MAAVDGYVIRNDEGAFLTANHEWSTSNRVAPAIHTAEQVQALAQESAGWAMQPRHVWRAAILGDGRFVAYDARPRGFADESRRLRNLVGSARVGAMGQSAVAVHASLAANQALAKAVSREDGLIDFRHLAQLVPTSPQAPAHAWHALEETLGAVAAELRKDTIQLIVTANGDTFPRCYFVSTTERDLRRAWVDPAKARVLARAATQHFAELDPPSRTALVETVTRYANFIGVRTTNAERILLRQPVVRENPALASTVRAFITTVATDLATLYANEAPSSVAADTVVILTRDGGGAHLRVADTIESSLRGRVPTKKLNLSGTGLVDPLERTLGVCYADTYNVFFQQAGRRRAAELAQELNALLLEFIPTQHYDYLRRQTGNARVIVSTTHWRKDVALAAEHDKRVMLQICDYGELNDNLREVADAVYAYALEGIEFLLPADILLTGAGPPTPQVLEAFRVRDYPVDPAWRTTPSVERAREVRRALGVREDSRVVTVMAGLRGAGNVLDDVALSVVRALGEPAARGGLPATDIIVVCGTNQRVRASVVQGFERSLASEARRLGLDTREEAEMRSRLGLVPAGEVDNADLAVLAQCSQAVVTKPGGRTSAELLAAGIARPIVVYDGSHPWEYPNLEALRERLHATAVANVGDVGEAIRSRLEHPVERLTTPSHGSVIERILEVHAGLHPRGE